MSAPDDRGMLSPRRTVPLLLEHSGLALTLLYLVLMAFGIVYETVLVFTFRASYLAFAETGDFLVAAIRHPELLLFAALSALVLWLLLVLDRWLRRRFPGMYRSQNRFEQGPWGWTLHRVIYPLCVVVYFLAFTITYVDHEGGRIRSGQTRRYQVRLAGETSERTGHLVTTTSKYLFLWVPADTALHIVPVESVSELWVRRNRAGSGHGSDAGAGPSIPSARGSGIAGAP